MTEWWNNLTQLTRIFYGAAAFFSVFFVWQLIAAIIGLEGDDGSVDDVDAADGADAVEGDIDHTYDSFEDGAETDAAETTMSFKLLSIRSIITFFTLFTWGSALYLNRGDGLSRAMGISAIWGLVGMLSVALIFWAMRKMTQSGTSNLNTCVGTDGTVYVDIPEGGFGEVKVSVSDVVTHVKARAADGASIPANTAVHVVKRTGKTTVSVEPINKQN